MREKERVMVGVCFKHSQMEGVNGKAGEGIRFLP